MKIDNISRQLQLVLAGILVILLAACAATTSAQSAAGQVKAAPSEPIEPWDGDGMDIPLDGTSLQAFERSLARVQAYTSPENYETLVNAIDYLMVYDLSAKRDRAKLAANLNGLTGNQVISKVSWNRPQPDGDTGKTEASNARVIDV